MSEKPTELLEQQAQASAERPSEIQQIGTATEPTVAGEVPTATPTTPDSADVTTAAVTVDVVADVVAPVSAAAPSVSPSAAEAEANPVPAPPAADQADSQLEGQAAVEVVGGDAQPTSVPEDLPDHNSAEPERRVSPPKPKSKARGGKNKAQAPTQQPPEATRLIPATATEAGSKGGKGALGTAESTIGALKTDLKASPWAGSFDLKKASDHAWSLGYGLHPILLAFPPKPEDEYQRLRDSIRETGLQVPIETWNKEIIDGLHRLAACMDEKITPTFHEWDGKGSLVEHVIALNIHRRHMTASTRAATAVELLPHFKEEAKERQRLHGGTAPGRAAATLPANLPGVKGDAREAVARMCGASARYVSDLARIKEQDPELYEEVRTGQRNVNRAVEALNSRKPEEGDTPARPHDGQQDGRQGEDDAVGPRNNNSSATVDAPSAGATAGTRPTNKKPSRAKGAVKNIVGGATPAEEVSSEVMSGEPARSDDDATTTPESTPEILPAVPPITPATATLATADCTSEDLLALEKDLGGADDALRKVNHRRGVQDAYRSLDRRAKVSFDAVLEELIIQARSLRQILNKRRKK